MGVGKDIATLINVSFNGSDARVVAALRAKAPRMKRTLTAAMDSSMLLLQRRVQEKLSGEVLEHRSGKLLASVNKPPVESGDDRILGKVTAAGGPAFYGRVQELGGTRTYDILPVNKLALAFFPGGSLGGAIASGTGMIPGKSTVRGLYGSNRMIKPGRIGAFSGLGGIVVKKVVHPPLPPRPFMKPSLMELQGEIVGRIRKAAVEALRG